MCCVSTSPFLKAKLTNLVQFNCCVLNAKTIKELLDSDTEGAGGLAEDHNLVVLDEGLHLLQGAA